MDEAHRVAGPINAKSDIEASNFTTILDARKIKAKRRLFMTATPRYFTGDDDEIASMDNPDKFGKVFHRLGFGEAIDRKLLTDYRVAIIGVGNATYRDWAERGVFVKLDDKVGTRTDARYLAGQIGVAKAMRKYNLRRVISFHHRVNDAKKFANSIQTVLDWMPARERPSGSLWATYATGEMSAKTRSDLLDHLKTLDEGERGLLSNARCLAEGVDVPALDGVAFIDPKRSEVEIVQAVGRAIRKSDPEKLGIVIIPVFVDTDEDSEIALNSSAFKPVWAVVKALRAHDDELGRQLDDLRREQGRRRGRAKLPIKIQPSFTAKVTNEFAAAFNVKLVERTTESWEFWYGLLEEFGKEYGDCLVPLRMEYRGYRLGAWCRNQRDKKARGRLGTSRIEQLESLHGWTWAVLDDKWEVGYRKLRQFVASEGHALVPQRFKTDDGFALGAWVNTQRKNLDRKKLDDQRRHLLEDVPGWCWDPKLEAWERGWAHIKKFVEDNGHARVKAEYFCADGYPLGSWVNRQRFAYSTKTLSDERRDRLNSLEGWSWDTHADRWERCYEALWEFAAKYGHSRVPTGFTTSDGSRLDSWIQRQRKDRDKDDLTQDRITRLEQIPGWTWDPFVDLWEQGYEHLAQFVRQHNTARVPKNFVSADGFRLGAWVHTQRWKYNAKSLPSDLADRLSSLKGWTWDPTRDDWEKALVLLREFVEQNSHCNVPAVYEVNGFGLGNWVSKQREYYRDGTLAAERVAALNAVRGWSWVRQR